VTILEGEDRGDEEEEEEEEDDDEGVFSSAGDTEMGVKAAKSSGTRALSSLTASPTALIGTVVLVKWRSNALAVQYSGTANPNTMYTTRSTTLTSECNKAMVIV